MQVICKYIWLSAILVASLQAAEPPYFVTYGQEMEEPGSLEVVSQQLLGDPKGGNGFLNHLIEFEYGLRGWWTTELYLSGQQTWNEGGSFTGYRWENRFRPLVREHWINPVIYVEFVHKNEADKSLREIVGHDSFEDQLEPLSITRHEYENEIETKLILSSNFKGWNVSENLIAEKNLSNKPWEFGYAVAASRPLALEASPDPCRFCRENFIAGLELYGGLGNRYRFGLQDTSHYIAPTLAWMLPNGVRAQVSPTFGLTDVSNGFLLRFAIGYEFTGLGRLFGGR
ncbi:MAG: hypothetical protein JWO19_2752 [Bryobacterales bacterium]|jgi:hypothetical protein|nr:hypothetical protein [Bryobacterales bacterium]